MAEPSRKPGPGRRNAAAAAVRGESIAPRESWGIPEVSRPEWLTFFKGGWLTSRRGNLVHQVARLEKGQLSLTIAILTDGNPSDAYGRATVRGIAARLLAR